MPDAGIQLDAGTPRLRRERQTRKKKIFIYRYYTNEGEKKAKKKPGKER